MALLQTTSLPALPAEVLIMILQELDNTTLLSACRELSRLFRAEVDLILLEQTTLIWPLTPGCSTTSAHFQIHFDFTGFSTDRALVYFRPKTDQNPVEWLVDLRYDRTIPRGILPSPLGP